MTRSELTQEQPEFDEEAALQQYREWVATNPLYTTLQILGMAQPRPLGEIYTDVYLLHQQHYLQEAELEARERSFMRRFDPRQSDRRFAGVDLLQREKRLFIVGQPGAGKTTFLHWLAVNVANGRVPLGKVPLYAPLRAWNDFEGSFWAFLAEPLTLSGFPTDAAAFVQKLLRQGRALVLLDGLDEVLPPRRGPLYQGIDALAQLSADNLLALTCRPHAETRRFQTFTYAQMADFTPQQMQAFIENWFGGAENDEPKTLWQALQQDENKPVQELARTPLLLGLLCISYRETGTFPAKRHELYEKALDVVLQEWDESRGVQRESLYGQLQWQKKRELLAYLGYFTFEREFVFIPQTELLDVINQFWLEWRQDVIRQQQEEYGQVYPPELPPNSVDGRLIIRDIAAQHGLLVQQADGYFSFSHLTLHEYFTACYIVDNERRGTVQWLMAHVGDDRWNEVFLLVAGMLHDATAFGEAYLQAAYKLVADEQAIVRLIYWAEQKRAQAPAVRYRPPALRAFLHSRARGRDLDLARVRVRDLDIDRGRGRVRPLALDLARDLALDLARDRDLALDLDRDRDLAHDHALALDLDLAHDHALALALALALAHDLALDRDLAREVARHFALALALAREVAADYDLDEMAAELTPLTAPQPDAPAEEIRSFAATLAHIQKKYASQWNPYQIYTVTDEEAALWQALDERQAKLHDTYMEAGVLLARCLEVATVPQREALLDKFLLPPEMWPDA